MQAKRSTSCPWPWPRSFRPESTSTSRSSTEYVARCLRARRPAPCGLRTAPKPACARRSTSVDVRERNLSSYARPFLSAGFFAREATTTRDARSWLRRTVLSPKVSTHPTCAPPERLCVDERVGVAHIRAVDVAGEPVEDPLELGPLRSAVAQPSQSRRASQLEKTGPHGPSALDASAVEAGRALRLAKRLGRVTLKAKHLRFVVPAVVGARQGKRVVRNPKDFARATREQKRLGQNTRDLELRNVGKTLVDKSLQGPNLVDSPRCVSPATCVAPREEDIRQGHPEREAFGDRKRPGCLRELPHALDVVEHVKKVTLQAEQMSARGRMMELLG